MTIRANIGSGGWHPCIFGLIAALAMLAFAPVQALTLDLVSIDDEVIGEIRVEYARRDDTLMDIARWVAMGHHEIRRANPEVDLWRPGEGTEVLVPARFVVPDGPRTGILLNLPEKRLYYFHGHPDNGKPQVTTYPVGIGKAGRETPTGSMHITARLEDPTWFPTDGVIADYASRGIELARRIPPGPDNPLGRHALVLSKPGYLIHGTNRPDGVGMRVSQGCIRLYPEHIERLVFELPLGTPVHIVDQPVKLGLREGRLYLEVHPTVDGETIAVEQVVAMVERRYRAGLGAVDWELVRKIARQADGIPRAITADA